MDEVMTGFRVALAARQACTPRRSPALCPTSPSWARSLAAACRWRRLAARRAVMEHLAPWARCTRLAPVGQPHRHRLRPGHAARNPKARLLWPCPPRRANLTGLKAAPTPPVCPSASTAKGGMFGFLPVPRAAAELRQSHDHRQQKPRLQHPVPRHAGPRRLHRPGICTRRFHERAPTRPISPPTLTAATEVLLIR